MGIERQLSDQEIVTHCKERHKFDPKPRNWKLPAWAIIRLRETHVHVHMDFNPGPDHLHSLFDESVIERDK